MNRSDLLPGDVVFPLSLDSAPWVVVSWGEGGQTMLYLCSEGGPTVWEDPDDHAFDPGVLIVRGREAVNGRWP